MSSIEFIKTDETAKLPEKQSEDYVIFSNEQVSLGAGEVRKIRTGVAFAPPASIACRVLQMDGVAWVNSPSALGAGDEREIEIRVENKTENAIQINKGDALALICSCDHKHTTEPSVSAEQIASLRESMLNKLSKSSVKKIV